MIEFAERVAVDWHRTLEDVLARAAAAGPKGLVVFDLDSTIFDNRPRQARIVREFGREKGIAPLESCQSFHFVSGWDLTGALVACGLPKAEADGLHRELKKFWGARFFTSEYCRDDVEIVGAPRYLHEVVKTKARILYVTGRHEGMREGTVASMKKCRMVLPGEGAQLLMKPAEAADDDDYKRTAHQLLAELGTVLAAFDNEPTHVNDYADRFVDAVAVHLATDHSGRPVKLKERVISVPHFAY
ncbi:MAG: hypothetical protein AB1730_13435 [Myxococcota bacterium]